MKMRLSCIRIFFILALFFIWTNSFAQNNNVELNKSTYTISELSREVKKQTNYNVSYNANDIDGLQKLNFSSKNVYDLGQILKQLEKYNIQYKIKGNTIFLIKKSSSKITSNNSKRNSSTRKNNKKNTVNNNKSTQQKDVVNENTKQYNVSENKSVEGFQNPEQEFVQSTLPITSRTKKKSYLFQDWKVDMPLDSDQIRQRFKSNLVLNFGVYSDDVFYGQPFIEFGYSYLTFELKYAWSTQPIQHLRYGLNLQIPINEKSDINIGVNYGQFDRPIDFSYYEEIPSDDSTLSDPEIIDLKYNIQTKNKLWQFRLTYVYNLSSRLDCMLGAHLYHLNTSLLHPESDNAFVPNLIDSRILDKLSEQNFYTVSNFGDIYNDFSFNQSSYKRLWPSLHLGVRYKFFKKK